MTQRIARPKPPSDPSGVAFIGFAVACAVVSVALMLIVVLSIVMP